MSGWGRNLFFTAGAIALAAGAHSLAQQAPPSPFVARVNAIYEGRDRAVPADRRAELTLLPKVAAMDPAPDSPALATPLRAALLAPGHAAWADAAAWAQGPNQQAALDALRAVGDPAKRMAFLQGYGRDAADPAVRNAGLYTELPAPGALGAADFGALRGLDRLHTLVHVEATRLAADGKGPDAALLLARWTMLARMILDREFLAEKRWGFRAALAGLERTLDVVHEFPDAFTDTDLKAAIDALGERELAIDQIRLPQGDRLAAEQVIADGFVEREGASPDAFGAVMARITARGRPLAQFGEAARWQATAGAHAGTFDTIDALAGVYGDWEARWALPPFDRVLDQPSDYDRLDKPRFAAVDAVVGGVREMFDLRTRLRAQAVGTRLALGLVAFEKRFGKHATALAAIRPAFVAEIAKDPYTPAGIDYHFFVPIRDFPRGPRDLPQPYVVSASIPGVKADPRAAALAQAVQQLAAEVASFGDYAAGVVQGFEMGNRSVDEARTALEAQQKALAERLEKLLEKADPELKDDLRRRLSDRVTAAEAALRQAALAELQNAASGSQRLDPAQVGARLAAVFSNTVLSGASFAANAAASLDDSTFVLYSVGPDRERHWARAVGEGGSDLLLWPPLLSIARDALGSEGPAAIAPDRQWLDYAMTPFIPGSQPADAERRGGSRPGSQPARPGGRRPGIPGN